MSRKRRKTGKIQKIRKSTLRGGMFSDILGRSGGTPSGETSSGGTPSGETPSGETPSNYDIYNANTTAQRKTREYQIADGIVKRWVVGPLDISEPIRLEPMTPEERRLEDILRPIIRGSIRNTLDRLSIGGLSMSDYVNSASFNPDVAIDAIFPHMVGELNANTEKTWRSLDQRHHQSLAHEQGQGEDGAARGLGGGEDLDRDEEERVKSICTICCERFNRIMEVMGSSYYGVDYSSDSSDYDGQDAPPPSPK